MSSPLLLQTRRATLALSVDDAGRLRQHGFGATDRAGIDEREVGVDAFPAWGSGWAFEPALQVVHADGNTSIELRVQGVERHENRVRISLRDSAYPFFIDLLFEIHAELDVIEAWSEIRHDENGCVRLEQYASSSLDLGDDDLYLTQFHGAWAAEATMTEERLGPGLKLLDSKLAVRAHEFRAPWFLLSRGGRSNEDSGEVFGGSLAWSGSFRFAFENFPSGRTRVTCGVHPHASAWNLEAGEVFETPRMVWGWSDRGTGELSRNLHRFVRDRVIRAGDEPRAILLNNWEATYFDFDEAKIVSLFDGARELGMELFLLDDGWFGTKYPRDGDTQGLGDWTPDPKKLPNGLGVLVREANERGLRFGIWLEPEMVNPKSELFEFHPDWAIRQPHRDLDLSRHQMILDLSNPEVERFVGEVVDATLREHPGISYVKWDCNRFVTQPGSPYLPADRQSHLPVAYVRALYRVMERLKADHPEVEVMMCAGGGGRVDYGAMRFAHEFWPSDMTDPAKRIFIQWGFSHFFPPISLSNHVTEMNHRPLKFAFDVAMSGRMGMDMNVDRLGSDDLTFARNAIEVYKSIREVVQLGEQFRLESPYDGPRSAVMSVFGDRAVAFVYSLGDADAEPLRLKGLAADRRYRYRETNVGGEARGLEGSASGEELLVQGLPLPAMTEYGSVVVELRAV